MSDLGQRKYVSLTLGILLLSYTESGYIVSLGLCIRPTVSYKCKPEGLFAKRRDHYSIRIPKLRRPGARLKVKVMHAKNKTVD